MVMDYIRTCYDSFAYFYEQGFATAEEIWWYWAPEGASLFPERHSFGNMFLYQQPSGYTKPGPALNDGYEWSSGATPPGVVGDHFDGDVSWFLDGHNTAGLFLERWSNGIPQDCGDDPDPPTCADYPGFDATIHPQWRLVGASTWNFFDTGDPYAGLWQTFGPSGSFFSMSLRVPPDIACTTCSEGYCAMAVDQVDESGASPLDLTAVDNVAHTSTWHYEGGGMVPSYDVELRWIYF